MIVDEQDYLAHYGILRKSGRYPWGSGKSESERNRDFLSCIDMHRKDGMTDSEIARGYKITRNELHAARSIALAQQKLERIGQAENLKAKGMSNVAIGKQMGINESSVRSLLAPGAKDRANALLGTANMLKAEIAEKDYIDVGIGVERWVGVTRDRLDTAIAILREQDYPLHSVFIPQATNPSQYTTMKVLTKPGTTNKEINANRSQIQQIGRHSDDHGREFDEGFQTPINVSSRRVAVNYKEDGGDKSDGVIYVRPGVSDISLGSNSYGQVRISVDGTHYLKGMAVYKDDLPAGTDLVFNTNKSRSEGKKGVMKELDTKNPDFPFGAVVHQIKDPKTKKVTSAMNMVNDEGDWDKWSRTLSSQMLSKQSPKLAEQQLNMTYESRLREFKEISSLTNPTVRKELLLKFADSTDAASVHLKAANIPRQANKVILPINSIKPGEVYAPSMRDGERVVLIRFPHGGTFEIPELTVNNRNREAKKILGTAAQDAIGIHHTVAERLSGADFDGDTVLVIPNGNKSVKTTPALEGLKGFDPQKYKLPKDSPIPRMNTIRKGQEMGLISNLITDMTIGKASTEELSRAIRHSMVVIDAEKHELNFKLSEQENGIRQLREKYQQGKRGGASTLISKARSRVDVPQYSARSAARGGAIDKATGKKVYELSGKMVPEGRKIKGVWTPTGRIVPKKIKSKALVETDNAFTLSSGTQIETIYAEHSNKLMAMANAARKEAVNTKANPTSKPAKAVYANEVASLNAKLNIALKNAPLERQAQLLASTKVAQTKQSNPGMEEKEIKKIRQQAINEARIRTDAKKTKVKITQSEWNAIQAGAVTKNTLEKILLNGDVDSIKALALPKNTPKLTNAKLTRAHSMLASGYTQAEVADALGIGLTTLKVGLSE